MYYYQTVETDNGRLTECPECHNTEFSDGADYCRICGASRKNLCLNERYQHENPANARFCEACGSETAFFRYKLLTPWKDVSDDQKGEEPLTTAAIVLSPGFTAVETDELPF